MEELEKMEALETALGGPGKAAKAAGVTLTSWGRWKASGLPGVRQGLGRSVVDLLHEKYCSSARRTSESCAADQGRDQPITE